MNWKKEKTQRWIFTVFAVFIISSVVWAGPTYFGGPGQYPNTFFGDSDRFSRGDRHPSNNSRPFGFNGFDFPYDGSFDGKFSRSGWNWDGNFQFPDHNWNNGDQCGDWGGHTPAVPTPGSIVLASIGLGTVSLIRKRKIG